MKDFKLQQLRENYTGYSENQGVSYYEWLKAEEENSPSHFSWLFDSFNISVIKQPTKMRR